VLHMTAYPRFSSFNIRRWVLETRSHYLNILPFESKSQECSGDTLQ
jgi:hypothetical protein